jgi:hypothetical protein
MSKQLVFKRGSEGNVCVSCNMTRKHNELTGVCSAATVYGYVHVMILKDLM